MAPLGYVIFKAKGREGAKRWGGVQSQQGSRNAVFIGFDAQSLWKGH